MRFSIIIPIYNREDYLERSIGSVLDQTCGDWELILVDDGSTDSSWEKCLAYQAKDGRIRCFRQENGGPGAARNAGLEHVRGDYILFLDSDDWYEADCLEEVSKAIDKDHPDLVTFFMREWKTGNVTTVNKRLILEPGITNEKTCRKLMGRDISVGARAYRRELLESRRIRFLKLPTHEDNIFCYIAYACAQSVVQLHSTFYHYDKTVPVSAAKYSKGDAWEINLFSYQKAKEEFSKRGLIEDFAPSLGRACLVDFRACFFMDGKTPGEEQYDREEPKILELIRGLNPQIYFLMRKRYIVFGGYTLRSAVNTLVLNQYRSVTHYQFSSLEAALQETEDGTAFSHANGFRQKMVEHELKRDFLKRLREGDYDYLVVDLMEERFDLMEAESGLLTGSDAFEEGACGAGTLRRIARGSEQAEALFREALEKLKRALGAEFDGKRLVLVENYLLEGYGEFGEEEKFENLDELRATNQMLERYYGLFKQAFPQALTVTPDRASPICFTDKGYKHGCYPWHSVESWECDIADRIAETIGGALQ